ncbi:MAG: AAA family ATPase [Proteobacteria bacterium]|nr:AAA family ATPase [Pseudomonadota bacterium]
MTTTTHLKQTKEKDVTLRVATSFIEDEGSGLARMDKEDMQKIGASPGDCISITGRRTTVARAAQTTPEYSGQNILQIDGITRDNAQAGIDEWVTVKKVPFRSADSVLLSPVDPNALMPKDKELRHVRQLLAGLNVVVGDRVEIVLFGTRPQFYIIEGASPKGALRITPSTSLSFRVSDFSHEKTTRTSYEDIGGLEVELARIREMIELPLKFPELFTELGIDPPKGVLLFGPPGTGKTLIARTISNEVRAHFIHVNGPEVIHKFYGESEAKLRMVFEEAKRNAPAIIFLDEIDALAPKRAQVIGDVEKRVVAQLLALMDGLVSRGEVVIIGATNMPELLDPALRRPGRFDREITIGVPNKQGRSQILKIHSRKMPLGPDVDLAHLGEITHGYVGADLAALCKEAGMAALRRVVPKVKYEVDEKPSLPEGTKLEVTADDFIEAFKNVEPTSTREFMVERPHVKFEDVGGLHNVKKALLSIIDLPTFNLPSFTSSRMGPPKGILFSGPSGTGKTLMAKAYAGQVNQTLIAIDPPTLLSKWVGESEKGLREVFKRAKQVSPCVLFIDDIDALAISRTEDNVSSTTQRLTSQLFREMDELQSGLGVTVLAATNRIDLLDPGLMRAGRLDYILEFEVPERNERVEIFNVFLKGLPLDAGVDVDALADMSEGYTGADIEALCKRAVIFAFEDAMKAKEKVDLDSVKLTAPHFERAASQQAMASERPSAVKH